MPYSSRRDLHRRHGEVKKVRGLFGDEPEESGERFPEWYKGDSDDEGDSIDVEHVRFGEDVSSWRWVVGIHNGKSLVLFIRIPRRTSRTLLAVISK